MSELTVVEDAVEEAVTVWDVLHKIIDRVGGWHTEEDQKAAHAAINAADPSTKDLPQPPPAEVLPQQAPPTVAETLAAAAAQEAGTGGNPLHAASSDTTEASPDETMKAAPVEVDPTPGAVAPDSGSTMPMVPGLTPMGGMALSAPPLVGAGPEASSSATDEMPADVKAWLDAHPQTEHAPEAAGHGTTSP